MTDAEMLTLVQSIDSQAVRVPPGLKKIIEHFLKREAALKEANDGEFKRGVKTFFDYLIFRTANHYHGNSKMQEYCDADNKVITDWAEDALESITPEAYATWVEINALQEKIKLLEAKVA